LELRGEVLTSLAQACQNREGELRAAADLVGQSLRKNEGDLSLLQLELETDRDQIIDAVRRRCQEHIGALCAAAANKDRILTKQQEALLDRADDLSRGREAARGVVCGLDATEQPLELVQTCLQLKKKMAPVMEAKVSMEPVDKSHLRVILPPSQGLLETIMKRGWAGSAEVDITRCQLLSPGTVAFPLESTAIFTLETKDHRGEKLSVAEGVLDITAKVMSAAGREESEVAVVGQLKSEGVFELSVSITENLLDHDVYLHVTIGGQQVHNSPAIVHIVNNPLQSSIVTVHHHRQALQSLLRFLPDRSFRLLYRASRDGWGAEDFHRLCDHKGPTLMLLKPCGNGSIFGGYTSQSWDCSGAFKTDYSAFLFSLVNIAGIGATKLPIKSGQQSNAIFCVGESMDMVVKVL